jgi:hypothetical protein
MNALTACFLLPRTLCQALRQRHAPATPEAFNDDECRDLPEVLDLVAAALLGEASAAPIDRIRSHLVGLRMPRALETFEHVVQQLERGQLSAIGCPIR